MKIVGLRVGVVDAPAGHDLGADIGFVVAVGVFEKEEARGLGDDDAAIGEGETGGDIEAVGKDGELVGAAVAVGVFADLDAVVAQAVGLHVVRIVAGFGDPGATTFVPGHPDRLRDVGFAGEEHEAKIGGDLGALDAAFDLEGKLKRDGLGALFVVGDGGAGLAFLRLALGEKFFPAGDAGGAEGGEEFGFCGEGIPFGGGISEGGGGEHVRRGHGGEGFGVGVGGGVEDDEVEFGDERRRGGGGIVNVVEPDGVTAEVAHEDVGIHARRAVRRAEVEHAEGLRAALEGERNEEQPKEGDFHVGCGRLRLDQGWERGTCFVVFKWTMRSRMSSLGRFFNRPSGIMETGEVSRERIADLAMIASWPTRRRVSF